MANDRWKRFGGVALVLGAAALVVGVAWGALSSLRGDPDLIDLIHSCDAQGIEQALDEHGWTGGADDLAFAAECGPDVVAMLLEAGAQPIEPAAVIDSMYAGDARVIRLLLERGADPDGVDEDGRSPLQQAAAQGHAEMVALLLARDVDVNRRDVAGDTALLRAAQAGALDVADALLAAGADPNLASDRGHSPLLRAVLGRHSDVVERLLAAGATPDAQATFTYADLAYLWLELDGEGDDLIAELGPSLGLDGDLVRVAADEGLRLSNVPDDLDFDEEIGTITPLYLAVVRDDPTSVEALLGAGADPAIGSGRRHHLPVEAADLLGHEDIAADLRAAAPR